MRPGGMQTSLEMRAAGATLAAFGPLDYFHRHQLESELSRLCAGVEPVLTLDLSEVDFMDSSAARFVLGAVARLTREGRKLCLVGARGQVRKMLCILGLEAVLEDVAG